MGLFEDAFTVVIGYEGGYNANPVDPGNWTGGRCGIGNCRGTNWGISASAYPRLDIPSLSQAQAEELYKRDYWDAVQCGQLPPQLALLVFDAAVNNGVRRAERWLQAALRVPQNGSAGSVKLALIEVQAGKEFELCSEFQAQRLAFMASLPTWRTFGLGWARRLCALPFESIRIGKAS